VLDPFAGSATTIQVARDLGRRSIGIELYPKYEDAMRQRLQLTPDRLQTGEVEFTHHGGSQ
jgi:DNA modification methylase